jgi:hypothetical protein
LDGVAEPWCPECGTRFDPDNARTYAPDDGGERRVHAIAASFAGAFFGWTLAYALHVANQVYSSGFGYLTDVGFWRFWTSATVLVWWVLLVVPLLWFRPVLKGLRNRGLAIVCGAAHGAVGYLLVIAWLAGIWWYTITFAAIVGAVSGLLVSTVLRWRRARSADPPRWLPWTLVGMPPLFLLGWLGLAWPTIAWLSPHTQYTFGSHRSRDQAIVRALSRVVVGDRYDELHRMLPDRFQEVEPVGGAGSTSSWGSIRYEVLVKDGVITKIQYEPLR